MTKNSATSDRIKVIRAALVFLHPLLFSLEKPRPFAIGLHHAVRQEFPELPMRDVRDLLGWLGNRRAYLKACTEGATRYGLNGPAGQVTASEAQYAVERFIKRNETAEDKWDDDAWEQAA